jgi:hypothetical protein
VVLLGAVQVGYDRNGFDAAGLEIGVTVPRSAQVLRSGASWNGQRFAWSAAQSLPIGGMEAAGLLDSAPLVAGVATTVGATRLVVRTNPDMVWVTQLR